VAQWLNVFLRKSHVLKIACVAQIVNVISWLQTKGDKLLKQPSYYVFKLVSNLARGEALVANVKAPHLETKEYGTVPVLDVSASYDAEVEQGAVFLVNRSQTESVVTEVIWQDGKAIHIDEVWQLTGSNPKESNSWDEPNRLVANPVSAPTVQDDRATIQLPPLSFTVIPFRL
jgi:alpha-N-arabinofuranosidase